MTLFQRNLLKPTMIATLTLIATIGLIFVFIIQPTSKRIIQANGYSIEAAGIVSPAIRDIFKARYYSSLMDGSLVTKMTSYTKKDEFLGTYVGTLGDNMFNGEFLTIYPTFNKLLPYELLRIRFSQAINEYTERHDLLNMSFLFYKFPLDSKLYNTSKQLPICDSQALKNSPNIENVSMMHSEGGEAGACHFLLELRQPKSALWLSGLAHNIITNDSSANIEDFVKHIAVDSKSEFLETKHAIVILTHTVFMNNLLKTHDHLSNSVYVMSIDDNKFQAIKSKGFSDINTLIK
jgi:hypothetical protein